MTFLFTFEHELSDLMNIYQMREDCTNYCFNFATERLTCWSGFFFGDINKDLSFLQLVVTINTNSPSATLFDDCCVNISFVQTIFWNCTDSGIQFIMNDKSFVTEQEQLLTNPEDQDEEDN